MKVNRSSRSNLRFLFGSVFFFAVLIFTMVLFVFYVMGEAANKVESKMFAYNIHVFGNQEGRGYDVLLDDSLVFSSPAVYADTSLMISRYFVNDTVFENGSRIVRELTYFTPESVLRVVDSSAKDTLAMEVGENSNVEVALRDGKVRVFMYE